MEKEFKVTLQKKIASSIALLLLSTQTCTSLFAATMQKASHASAQGKYALLVGINEYPVKPLSGPIEDIKDFKNMLVETFQFPGDEQHIVELLDEKATKKNIVETFRAHLIENAKKDPKGLFVFEFSGHGVQVTDDKENPDEPDNLDEALVPFDVNGKVFKNTDQLRKSLLTDDELSILLKDLCKETKNVIIVTDCCRSGTNLRAIGAVSRHLEMNDFGLENGEKISKEPIKNFLQDFDFASRSDRYIAISGSDASHDACETYQRVEGREDKYNGLMTHHLINLLKTSRSDITYRQLADRLKALVSVESAQNPQVEGDIDRYVFANYGEKADPFFSVFKFEDNKATIKAGTSLGIKNGAVFSFYDEKTKFLRGKDGLLASGTVVSITPFSSIVELDTKLSKDTILKSKAILASPESAIYRQRISLDTSVTKLLQPGQLQTFLKDLKEASESSVSLNISAAPEEAFSKTLPEWNLAICASEFANFTKAGGRTKEFPSENQIGLYLCRPNGQPVQFSWVSASSSDLAYDILERASTIANQDTVRAIANESSKLRNKIETTIWLAKEIESKQEKKVSTAGHMPCNYQKTDCISKNNSLPRLKEGQKVIVSVENKSDTPLFVYMVSLGTSGSVTPLYPVQGREEKLTPNAKVDLDSTDIFGPAGHETFKIFASTQKIALDSLRREGNFRSISAAPRSTEDKSGPQLQNIILRAAGTHMRSSDKQNLISTFDQDWTTTNLDFVID